PSLSESTMVARDAALAAYEAARVHFQHLSCAESVQALATAKDAGADVSAEVCPHHLTLTDDVVTTLDSRFKMNQPLRAAPDRRLRGRGRRLRQPLGQLLLPRADAAGQGSAHAGGRDCRVQNPDADRGTGDPLSAATAYVLLEDGARFDGVACGADAVPVGE